MLMHNKVVAGSVAGCQYTYIALTSNFEYIKITGCSSVIKLHQSVNMYNCSCSLHTPEI